MPILINMIKKIELVEISIKVYEKVDKIKQLKF